MKHNLRLNLLMGIIQPVLVLIINYFVKQTLRYQMGQEYLGLQSVYANYSDILVFAFSGVGIAMLFRLYKPFSEGNKTELQSLFTYYNRLFKKMTVIAGIVGLLFTLLLVLTVNVTIPLLEVIAGYLLFMFAVLLFNRYSIYYYFLWADQKRYYVCAVWGGIDLIAMFSEIYILTSMHSYLWFLVVLLAKNIVESLLIYGYAAKKHPFIKTKGELLLPETEKSLLSDVKDMTISRVGNILISNTDNIIISLVVSTIIAGSYSAYYFVTYGIEALITGFFDSLMSKVGQIMTNRKKEEHFPLYLQTYALNLCITAVVVSAFYHLSEHFICLWMGPEVLLSHSAVVIITINLFMTCMRHTSNTFRQSAGLFSKMSTVILIRGILNILVSLLLGYRFGILGVLLATTLTDGLTVYWYEPYLILKNYGKSYIYDICYQVLGVLATLTTVYITGRAIATITSVTWFTLILKGIISIASGALWMFIIFIPIYFIFRVHFTKTNELK